MKKKTLDEIKFGVRVYNLLSSPNTFNEVVSKSSLDKLSAQKVLADLQKHGYICKDDRNFWVAIGDSRDAKETSAG